MKKSIADHYLNVKLVNQVPTMKTKVFYHLLPVEQRECIVDLLSGVNKVSIKLTSLEYNNLVLLIRSEFFELSHICFTYFSEMSILAASSSEDDSE